MKTKRIDQLYLVLKKQYFDEILAGTKTEEYRDFTDFYINRLCLVDEKGEILDTKKYETVKFQMGYNKDAPQMIVEVKDVLIDMDEDVDLDKDMLTTENCNFTIVLGKILEKKNC